MTRLLQTLLCGLAVTAPWLCGAVTPRPQFFLALVLTAMALLRFVQRLFQSEGPRSFGIPTVLFVPFGFFLIGAWQLSPSGTQNPLQEIESATFSDLVSNLVNAPDLTGFSTGLHTLSPDSTRLFLAQLGLATLAFWLSFDLFEDGNSRRGLYLILALNGLVMAAFGVAQQLTWNGKLFWVIPMRFGGNPFGPFVSRNNGAGYLLLTFACAFSSLISAWFPFGLGQRSAHSESLSEKLSRWMLKSLGQLTPGVLLSFSAVAAIVVGIFSSLCRAGVVGLLASTLVLIPAMNRWKTRMIVCVMLFISLSYAGLIWIGQDARFFKRIDTLQNISAALQGRVDHWKEIKPLVKDFTGTGSGWGTYPLINPLYVSSNKDMWFQHAENQYLEILAEAGAAGVALFILGMLQVTYASARAIRTDNEGRQLASGVAGLLSVTAMAIMSLTDFSMAIGSIVLTFCIIAGSVYSPYSKIKPVSPLILTAKGTSLWRILCSAVLLLTSGLGIYQLQSASAVETVVDAIPTDYELPTLEVSECDQILKRLNTLSIRHPQIPGLWAASGELRIYRYRRMMFDDMLKQPQAQKIHRRVLWGYTHLERLDSIVTSLRLNGDLPGEQRLIESLEIRQNLPAALSDLNRCLKLNPLQRRASVPRAWLSHILGNSSTPVARNLAMLTGASDSDALYQLGLMSERMGETAETTRCWTRCLAISDKWSTEIWDQATKTRDEHETLSLYPDRLEPLLAVASIPLDLGVKRTILSRCESIVAHNPNSPPESIAKLALAQNDLPRAAEAYLIAVQKAPYDIGLRMDASLILEQVGRLEEAREVVGVALALAPKRADVKKRFEKLISRDSVLPPKSPP